MDLAPFSQENFDPKDWINEVFQGHEEKEQYASLMVMKLQLAIEEVNISLEDTSQQVLSSLPRIVRDVESLGQEASLLKTQMAALTSELDKVNTSSKSSSLAHLVELDAVKTRLSQSAQALRQADNWTTLISEAEEVLDAGDLQAAAEKASQLEHCFSVLSQTPDSEDRAALLQSLKLRIEATAIPQIVDAFTHQKLSDSVKYCAVLRNIGRTEQAIRFYQQCTSNSLGAQWGALLERDGGAGANTLTQYYDTLVSVLYKQTEYVSAVFPDSDSRLLLCQLSTAALLDVEPSLHKVVSAALKLQEDPLQFLDAVKESMTVFMRHVRRTLGESAESCSEELKTARIQVTDALYAPLAHVLHQYGELERQQLTGHLVSAKFEHEDLAENLLQLRECCAKMKQQCELALARCKQVTGMAGWQGLIKGVTGFVSAFVAVLAGARQRVAAKRRDITEDWTVFGMCLDLINTAGVVLMSVEACDDVLCSGLGTTTLIWEPQPYELSIAALLPKEEAELLRMQLGALTEAGCGALSFVEVETECRACVEASLRTITSPLHAPLKNLPHLPLWTTRQASSALSAVLAPQEYVTQMGQYLLTLPQHLDPLLVSPNPALNRALQLSDSAHPGQRLVSESEVSAAEFLIGRVAHAACNSLADAALRIPHLQRHAEAQLVTDIEYIVNILEDLGVSSHAPLDALLPLLRASPSEYATVSEAVRGAPVKMVAAVRQMRDISANT